MYGRIYQSRSVEKTSMKPLYSCCISSRLNQMEINLIDIKKNNVKKETILLINNGKESLPPIFKLVNSPENKIKFKEKIVNKYYEIPPTVSFCVDLEFVFPSYIQPDSYIVIGKIQIDKLGEFDGFSYCIDVKETKNVYMNNDYKPRINQVKKNQNISGYNDKMQYSYQFVSDQMQNQENDNSFRQKNTNDFNMRTQNMGKQNISRRTDNTTVKNKYNFHQVNNQGNWKEYKVQSCLNPNQSSSFNEFDYEKKNIAEKEEKDKQKNVINQLNEEKEKQTNVINRLKEKNNMLVQQNEKLESEKKMIEQQYNDLNKKYNQINTNLISIDTFNNLKNEKTIIENKLNKSEQDKNALLNEINHLKEEVKQLKNEVENLSAEKENLNNFIIQQQSRNQNVNQVPSYENENEVRNEIQLNNNNFDENLRNKYKNIENYQNFNINQISSQPVNIDPTQINNRENTYPSVEENVEEDDETNINATNGIESNDNSGITPSNIQENLTKTGDDKKDSSNENKKLTEEEIKSIIEDLDRRYNVTSIFSPEEIRNAIIQGNGDDDKIQEILFE